MSGEAGAPSNTTPSSRGKREQGWRQRLKDQMENPVVHHDNHLSRPRHLRVSSCCVFVGTYAVLESSIDVDNGYAGF